MPQRTFNSTKTGSSKKFSIHDTSEHILSASGRGIHIRRYSWDLSESQIHKRTETEERKCVRESRKIKKLKTTQSQQEPAGSISHTISLPSNDFSKNFLYPKDFFLRRSRFQSACYVQRQSSAFPPSQPLKRNEGVASCDTKIDAYCLQCENIDSRHE